MYQEHDISEGPETRAEKLLRFLLEKSAKKERMRFFSEVTILNYQKGEKFHNLDQTFNIIMKGKLRNNDTGKVINNLNILADFPIQININIIMNDDPFIEKDVKWKDRINIEALEDT